MSENVQNIRKIHKLHPECYGKLKGGIDSVVVKPQDEVKIQDISSKKTYSHRWFLLWK